MDNNIHQLATQLDSIIDKLGTNIETSYNIVIAYITTWEPDFTYVVETLNPGVPPSVDKTTKVPTDIQKQDIHDEALSLYTTLTEQVLSNYLEYLKKEPSVTITAVDTYVSQFSSLMQLISLPNFDYSMVESLNVYNCLTYDNIFYILKDILSDTVNWTLADNTEFNDKIFHVFNLTNPTAFITYIKLNEWASSYYSVLVDYEGRPDSTDKLPFPAVVYNNILAYNEGKGNVSDEISSVSNDISKVINNIIQYLTYEDFKETKQNLLMADESVQTTPSKDKLLKKIYVTHHVNDFYTYLGYPEKCKNTEEEKIKRVLLQHQGLGITRESLIKEVTSNG